MSKGCEKISPRLKIKLKKILKNNIAHNPFSGKKLVGDLKGFYSVRLTLQDRIVYSIDQQNHIVFVHRARTHYNK
ncbi:MAG: type II toxin-antitoxin system YoeB family toxin [Caldisericaceae bacterium]|nr:type II toxin-antitoxin system YoeB family toxin [Caldisericaceae bacterium]